jgi:hypothetical protein
MSNEHADHKKKTVDLPPRGDRNPDPITKEAGAHPIEVGIGTALGGAAAGLAAGAAAGPVGAVIGAVVGGVAGGYGGKAVGEAIDPTTEDTWLRDSFGEKKYVRSGDTFDTYAPAYRYGGAAEARHGGRPFDEAEADLRAGWAADPAAAGLPWDHARLAVRDSYERTCQLRKQRAGGATAG